MDTATIFNLQNVLSLVLFFLITKWYILPWLLTLGPDEAPVPLLLYSGFRFLGTGFMVPSLTDGLNSAFATPAGYGDLTVGLVALVAAIVVKMGLPFSRILVWAYAILGTADFAYAGSQMGVNDVPNHIGSLWHVMTVGGASWMIAILFIFRLLIWPAPPKR